MSSFVTGFNVKLPQEPENLKEEPMDAGVAVGWAAAPPPTREPAEKPQAKG